MRTWTFWQTLIGQPIKPRVTLVCDEWVSGTFVTPKESLAWKELECQTWGKSQAPAFPLESSVRDFGDPNPCCAQLFNPEPERKWVCGGVGAERGKLRSVIVAWLQSCQLAMLSSEIPPKPDNIRIPSNTLWLPLKCHWRCLALQFAGSNERARVIEINLRLVMGMEMNTSFMLWIRSESWILRQSLVSLESRLLTL